MAGKKVRYVVPTSGGLREIFSVAPQKNGDLSIFRNGTDEVLPSEFSEGGRPERDKFSVHVSSASPDGRFLSKTIVYGDDVEERHSAFVTDAKSNFLWHVFSTIPPSLTPARYDLGTARTLEVVELSAALPPDNSLCVHVFVTTPDRELPSIANCRKTETAFEQFKLVIYTCFLNLPASHFSVDFSIPTRMPKRMGEPLADDDGRFETTFPNGAENLQESEVPHIVASVNQLMYEELGLQIYGWLKETAPQGAEAMLKEHRPYFAIAPHRPGQTLVVAPGPTKLWSPQARGSGQPKR